MEPTTSVTTASILDIVFAAPIVVQFVMALLVFLSFWSWSLIVSKSVLVWRANQSAQAFEDTFWRSQYLSELYESEEGFTKGPLGLGYYSFASPGILAPPDGTMPTDDGGSTHAGSDCDPLSDDDDDFVKGYVARAPSPCAPAPQSAARSRRPGSLRLLPHRPPERRAHRPGTPTPPGHREAHASSPSPWRSP